MTYSNLNYAYPVARIRVLETRLLKKNDIERMIGAKTPEEAYKVLNDLDYSNHVGDIQDVSSFQDVINSGLREVKELLDQITPYKEVLDILWYRYDFHNIRTLIRAKVHPMDEGLLEEDYLIHLGSYSHNLLQKFIFNREYGEKIEEALKEVMIEGEKIFEETDDSFQLDLFLDRKFFEITGRKVRKFNNAFIKKFHKMSIDIANMKTILRLKTLELKHIDEDLLFIPGGSIPVNRFKSHIQTTDDQFLEEMSFTEYAPMLTEGIKHLKDERSFLEIEKELDNYIVEHMKKAKIIAFGPEPIFAYFWAKANNAQIIRTIMVGKINSIDESIIRSRLRELYI